MSHGTNKSKENKTRRFALKKSKDINNKQAKKKKTWLITKEKQRETPKPETLVPTNKQRHDLEDNE